MYHFSKFTRFIILLVCLLLCLEMPLWGADSPSDVVGRFCKMDYDGFRTQIGNNKIYKLMEAGDKYVEPGWDTYIIIAKYEIIKQHQNQDGSIMVSVRYSKLATFDSTPQIERNKVFENADFTLIKSHNTWKIKSAANVYPMISKQSAIKWIKKWKRTIVDKGMYQGGKLGSKEKTDLLNKLDALSEEIGKL